MFRATLRERSRCRLGAYSATANLTTLSRPLPRLALIAGRRPLGLACSRCHPRRYSAAAQETDQGVVQRSARRDAAVVLMLPLCRHPTTRFSTGTLPAMSTRCTCNGSGTRKAFITHGRCTSAISRAAPFPLRRPSSLRPPSSLRRTAASGPTYAAGWPWPRAKAATS